MQWLDEHGSRGLSGFQVQLTELTKNITKLEAELRRVRAARWQAVAAYIGALAPVLEGVCPGQVQFEYPATSVLFSI